MDILTMLFQKQDIRYKNFHSKLIPDIDCNKIIGVRIPEIRKLAKLLKNTDSAIKFTEALPHYYYEENNLHVFLISGIKDYDLCVKKINEFLPYIDNWATCDSLRPESFSKNKEKLLKDIEVWIKSEKTFTVRFAVEMLMVHFLDDDFDPSFLDAVCSIRSNEYYINMMIAWYFATALAKQWGSAIHIIEERKLPVWLHNKTIQKSSESFRITNQQKSYLKSLKIKTTDKI